MPQGPRELERVPQEVRNRRRKKVAVDVDELARDNRWRIFWLMVIWLVIGYLFQIGFTSVVSLLMSSAGSFGDATIWIYYVVIAVYSSVTNMIGATGSASLYCELRTIKEGAADVRNGKSGRHGAHFRVSGISAAVAKAARRGSGRLRSVPCPWWPTGADGAAQAQGTERRKR